MLCIGMKPGDYVTVGDDIVVQYTGTEGKLGTVLFDAPREVPVLRGQVRERQGMAPPDCLRKGPFKHPGSIKWGVQKTQLLREVRSLVEEMEDRETAQAIAARLDRLFPPEEY